MDNKHPETHLGHHVGVVHEDLMEYRPPEFTPICSNLNPCGDDRCLYCNPSGK